MKVSIQEVRRFACAELSHKNFIGEDSILEAGHLIKCGVQPSYNSCDDVYKIIAFCLQTLHLKDNPHEIVGEILSDGQIVGMSCSCKAGSSETCKHVVATLLVCNRNDFDKLQPITCTDKKCAWSAPHKAALEKYDPNPLAQHSCFESRKEKKLEAATKKHKKPNSQVLVYSEPLKLTEEDNEIPYHDTMVSNLHCSALKEHIAGRHEVLQKVNDNSTCDPLKIQAIFDNQLSSKFPLCQQLCTQHCPAYRAQMYK